MAERGIPEWQDGCNFADDEMTEYDQDWFHACLLLAAVLFLAISGHCQTHAPANVGQRSIVLTWTDSDGTVASTGVCNGTPTPYANSTTKSYTDTAVVGGATYVYAVSALNSAGVESACSAEAQATVPLPPVAPTNLQVTTPH